ncbi:uncharacterized protein LOC128897146 [Hylaeus anthracinus]|uniref:uncharacterized protein LOC128897146 n=1 Tax=Hylaeus anthracinus TaxID=313031 RepID=UPI0023B891A3|nr:uncharacterized protein LOC128897146 [Hylaeus anthracinus]
MSGINRAITESEERGKHSDKDVEKGDKEGNKDENKENEPEVDESLLSLLGDDPQNSKAQEVFIHSSLRSRWKYWIQNGLAEEEREKIIKMYKKPTFLDPPLLNAEIKGTMKESAIKRDTYMMELQNLAGTSLTALGSLLSILMTQKECIDQELFVERLRDATELLL